MILGKLLECLKVLKIYVGNMDSVKGHFIMSGGFVKRQMFLGLNTYK